MLPYCISPSLSEGHEAKFSSTDFFSFLKNPRILGLEELMDTRGVIHSNPVLWKTADGTESKFPGGYSSFLSLNSEDCSLLKLQTGQIPKDFSYTLDEVHAGMHIHIKEDSAVHKLETSIQGILSKGIDSRSFSFCTDGKKVGDILREGHINHLIRRAISLGLPVGKAYQMASINAAECYHLSHLGVIAPGKQADLVLLSDPKKVDIEAVFHKGKRVEKKEKYPISHCPKELKKHSISLPWRKKIFTFPSSSRTLRLSESKKGKFVTAVCRSTSEEAITLIPCKIRTIVKSLRFRATVAGSGCVLPSAPAILSDKVR